MPRYLIAIYLPIELETTLRTLYQNTFNHPCPVRTLHTTLIPPFMIGNPSPIDLIQSKLAGLPDFPDEFQTGKPGIFTTLARKILYLPLTPEQPLQSTYQLLYTALKPRLSIATNGFRKNKLPKFLPHITLNYNFKDDPEKFNASIQPFKLPKPQLLIEKDPGVWKPITDGFDKI